MDVERQDMAEKEHFFFFLRRWMIYSVASSHGLYPGQLPVLEYIQSHQGCTQNDIALKIGVSPASIAASTKRLQKTGLIYKRTDMANMRRKQLFVTPEGKQVAENCRKEMNAFQTKVFDSLDAEKIKQYAEILELLTNRLQATLENVPPFISFQKDHL